MSQHHLHAVVFAYHNVGVHCIKTLLAKGIVIDLVVTHEDSANETIWFESVAALCLAHNIPTISPADPNTLVLIEKIKSIRPDFIFSFYYRHMLPTTILSMAKRGAYNMHGSLLPKYRGRVPVNWAVLHGEAETGMTLHAMVAKPDAGDIIAQTIVPIFPDDTAFDVFGKLTVAAEQTLWNALPALISGTAISLPNDLSKGSYFGGRTPEDGRVQWQQTAQQVYNLYRAVAPPYPGAFTEVRGKKLVLSKACFSSNASHDLRLDLPLGLSVVDNVIFGVCGDGKAIKITELLLDNQPVTPAQLEQMLSIQ